MKERRRELSGRERERCESVWSESEKVREKEREEQVRRMNKARDKMREGDERMIERVKGYPKIERRRRKRGSKVRTQEREGERERQAREVYMES